MIGIAKTFFGNNFSFKSYLYFRRYMHGNTKNKMWVPKNFFIFDFIYFE